MNKNPFKKSEPFIKKVYGNKKGELRIKLLYEQINKALPKIERIADIGCGTAPVSIRLLLKKKVKFLFLSDHSENILGKAKDTIIKNKLQRKVLFDLNDHENALKKVKEQHVDLILSHAVLNWLEDPMKGLEKLIEVAKETNASVSLMVGSEIGYILDLASKGNLTEVESVLKNKYVVSESYPEKKLYLFNPYDLIKKIEASGMQIISKNSVRALYDLNENINGTYKGIFTIESKISNSDEYWSLGDMVHVIFKPKEIKNDIEKNVFASDDSIKRFLNPENTSYTPLVELPKELNPFFHKDVRIFAKLMNFLPLGNVKSLPAYNMLLEQKQNGGLKGIHSLIENSSGNTVFSLAVIGRLFGVSKTKAIVSHEVTWGKLQLLRLFGTEIFVNEEPICPDPNDKNSGIYLAKQVAKKKGWLNPGQYDNPANPEAHIKWTGPQIWEQTAGKISVFCAGLGTTGTILGTSKYLKKQSKNIVTIGVARKPNNPVPGVRTPYLLREIDFDWKNYVDHIKEIGTKESFESSLALCRAGLMVGPSAGFALAGLLDFIKEKQKLGQLDTFRNKDGEIIAVFICPDSPLPYIDEYFEYLDDSYFPKIENENLLINKPDIEKKKFTIHDLAEVKAEDAYNLFYSESKKMLWQRVNQHKDIALNKDILIVDVRTSHEFQHFHIPGSRHIELQKLTKQLSKLQKEAKDKKVIFVCKTGNRSGIATQLARAKNIDALNLIGGVTEWSRLNLPRVRPKICIDINS